MRQKNVLAVVLIIMTVVSFGGLSLAKFHPSPMKEWQSVYRSKIIRTGSFETLLEQMDHCVVKGVDAYRFTVAGDGGKTVAWVRADDLRPIRVEFRNGAGEPKGYNEYEGDKAIFVQPGENRQKTLKNIADCYDQNSLACVFRSFPFESQEAVSFKLISDGRQGRAGVYDMVLKVLGKEVVTVPAGEFLCYKLEMGVAGLSGLFAFKYKFYYWYSAAEPFFLVKYADREGRLIELVDYR